mmetsp:Transcript_4664/g.16124  ORF Transcript_4664/g.16124 Transcript_4664/m.16124 type:complete len:286 (-) Transcript_4664:463-1320(-)
MRRFNRWCKEAMCPNLNPALLAASSPPLPSVATASAPSASSGSNAEISSIAVGATTGVSFPASVESSSKRPFATATSSVSSIEDIFAVSLLRTSVPSPSTRDTDTSPSGESVSSVSDPSGATILTTNVPSVSMSSASNVPSAYTRSTTCEPSTFVVVVIFTPASCVSTTCEPSACVKLTVELAVTPSLSRSSSIPTRSTAVEPSGSTIHRIAVPSEASIQSSISRTTFPVEGSTFSTAIEPSSLRTTRACVPAYRLIPNCFRKSTPIVMSCSGSQSGKSMRNCFP